MPGTSVAAGFTPDRDDGRERSMVVHVPAAGAEPYPLVVVLHGGGSSGAGMEEVTGLSTIADREGFVVVYPDGVGGPHGLGRLWNSGDCCGPPYWLGIDDGAMIAALLPAIAERLPIATQRRYLVGYSNGGALAFDVVSRFPRHFAAAAVYAASMPARGPLIGPQLAPPPDAPPSMLLIHARDDPRVPFYGREGLTKTAPGQRHIAEYWAAANGCRERRTLATEGAVTRELFEECDAGGAVHRLVLEDWDHEWPGPVNIQSARTPDDPFYDFDAAEEIWRFCSQYAR